MNPTTPAAFLETLRAGRTETKSAFPVPPALAVAIAKARPAPHAIPALVARGQSRVEEYTEAVETAAPRWHWQGDAAEGEAPSLAGVQPSVGEIVAEFDVSRRLMQDSAFDLEAFFVESAALAFAEAEALAFLDGNGTGRPSGLLAAITPATATLATLGDALRALRSATPFQYRRHWVMPSVLFDRLSDEDGFAPADNHGGPRLLGVPVEIDEACQSSGSALVLLGDLGTAYRAVDILPGKAPSPIMVQLNPYARKGGVGVQVSKRVGGCVRIADAVRAVEVALS